MGARDSRGKGKRGELEASQQFKAVGYSKARRSAQYSGGREGDPDVYTGHEGFDKNIHLEVKRTQYYRLYPALEQAHRDAGPIQIPVVLHKQNRKPWIVAMYFTDWVETIAAWVKEVSDEDPRATLSWDDEDSS